MKVESHLPGEAAPERRAGHACLRGNGPGPRPPRRPPGRQAVAGKANVPYLLFWVSLVVVTYFGMNALTAPKIAKVAVSNNGALEIVIPRSRNGHYFVEGAINGHPVTFMVDTGATTVAIDSRIARAARLPKGYPATFSTAGGAAQGETVPRQSVTVGGLRIDNVSIAVINGVGEVGLLGQNILRHMEVTQSGDQMVLRAKGELRR